MFVHYMVTTSMAWKLCVYVGKVTWSTKKTPVNVLVCILNSIYYTEYYVVAAFCILPTAALENYYLARPNCRAGTLRVVNYVAPESFYNIFILLLHTYTFENTFKHVLFPFRHLHLGYRICTNCTIIRIFQGLLVF
jgi:hypothetical protein